MSKQITGFLPYSQDDDDRVLSNTLTDGSNLSEFTQFGSAGTFDAVRGVLFAEELSGLIINWSGLGLTAADYVHGCSFGVEIQRGFFEASNALAGSIFRSFASTTSQFSLRRSVADYFDIGMRAFGFESRFRVNPDWIGKTDFVQVWVSFQFGGTYSVYVDGMLVSVDRWRGGSDLNVTTAIFNNLGLGAVHANGGDGPREHYMRNFQFVKRPITFSTLSLLRNVHIYGDSVADRGGYDPSTYWPVVSLKPDYPATSGSGSTDETNSSAFYDYGLVAACQRLLALNGMQVGHAWQELSARSGTLDDNALRKIQNYTIGSAYVDTGQAESLWLNTQLDRSLVNMKENPSLAIFVIGNNDMTNVAGVTLDATWKGLYTDELDRILVVNPNCKLVLATMTNPTNDPSYSDDSFLDRMDAINVLINEIGVTYSEASISDVSAAFGGHTMNTELYESGGRHPSAIGSKLYGETIAETIIGI